MRGFLYRHMWIFTGCVGLIASSAACLIFFHIASEYYTLFWIMIVLSAIAYGIVWGYRLKGLIEGNIRDSLTGLYNRKYFYDRLSYEMKRLGRYSSSLSLAIIDIDDFKAINDNYGHVVGDEVLRKISGLFLENTRSVDTVARWGGEEFAIILPETQYSGAIEFAERLRRNVEGSCECYGITICAGLITTKHELNIDKFISLADKALYQAKRKKNMVVGLDTANVNEPADVLM